MNYNFEENCFENLGLLPDKVAFVGSNGELSWKELFEFVNKIKLTIKKLNLPKGYPILIYGHKQYSFPASILACLVSEHPFIPIDELYPLERVLDILDESGTNVLLDCTGNFPLAKDMTIVCFNDKKELTISKNSSITLSKVPVFDLDRLSYILFTSGSTGKPKGVLIRKSSILSLVNWIKTTDFKMSSSDVFVNQSPFSFDVSLFDTFSTLNYGASMLMVSQDLAKKPDLFRSLLESYKVTFWTSTPSFIYLYQREDWFSSATLPFLKKFLFAGEPLPVGIVNNLHNKFQTEDVYNAYGPTEATVITTFFRVDKTMSAKYTKLPIGFSKPNSSMITLPENATKENLGELVIIGENVAEGYLNRPEQEKDRFFIYNGKKAYKTGDLGYIVDQLIFCEGRNDDQIKFNGYRIELEEISNKILSFNNIDEVRTVALKRDGKVIRLVAIYQAKSEINTTELKHYLKKVLPYYMLPSDVLKVDSFPLNSSGKIDRNKLQEFYLMEKKSRR